MVSRCVDNLGRFRGQASNGRNDHSTFREGGWRPGRGLGSLARERVGAYVMKVMRVLGLQRQSVGVVATPLHEVPLPL